MPSTGPTSASERRADARTVVVWDALRPVLGEASRQVLDIGGGTGVSAVRIAELGHRVQVIDPSPDALAALGRRAAENGVADRIHSRQGDLADLRSLVEDASVDVVLCHDVLEVVADPAAALAGIARVLRPGGQLSLLVAQHHATVVAKALAGHFGVARELLDDPGDTNRPQGRRFTLEEVTELVAGSGLEVTAAHGVRVFADLVPGSLLELEPGAAQALVDLERAVAGRPEYLALASQVHLLATR